MIKKIITLAGILLPIALFSVMLTDYYQIDPESCRNCGNCNSVCPNNAVYYADSLGTYQIRPDSCEACGDCVDFCRHDALYPVTEDVTDPHQSKSLAMKLTNHPDPFSQKTKIEYHFPYKNLVKGNRIVFLQIFNNEGDLVKAMRINTRIENTGSVTWHGKNNKGHEVPSGNYLFRLKGENFTSQLAKCTLVK